MPMLGPVFSLLAQGYLLPFMEGEEEFEARTAAELLRNVPIRWHRKVTNSSSVEELPLYPVSSGNDGLDPVEEGARKTPSRNINALKNLLASFDPAAGSYMTVNATLDIVDSDYGPAIQITTLKNDNNNEEYHDYSHGEGLNRYVLPLNEIDTISPGTRSSAWELGRDSGRILCDIKVFGQGSRKKKLLQFDLLDYNLEDNNSSSAFCGISMSLTDLLLAEEEENRLSTDQIIELLNILIVWDRERRFQEQNNNTDTRPMYSDDYHSQQRHDRPRSFAVM